MKIDIAHLLMIAIIIFWGLWGFFSKMAVEKIGTQAAFWSAITSAVTVILYLFFTNQLNPIKTNSQGINLALFAGLFSGLAAVLFYVLMGKRPAGLVIAVTALYPLVTITLSFLLLKEPITFTKGIGLILALAALFFLNL